MTPGLIRIGACDSVYDVLIGSPIFHLFGVMFFCICYLIHWSILLDFKFRVSEKSELHDSTLFPMQSKIPRSDKLLKIIWTQFHIICLEFEVAVFLISCVYIFHCIRLKSVYFLMTKSLSSHSWNIRLNSSLLRCRITSSSSK